MHYIKTPHSSVFCISNDRRTICTVLSGKGVKNDTKTSWLKVKYSHWGAVRFYTDKWTRHVTYDCSSDLRQEVIYHPPADGDTSQSSRSSNMITFKDVLCCHVIINERKCVFFSKLFTDINANRSCCVLHSSYIQVTCCHRPYLSLSK